MELRFLRDVHKREVDFVVLRENKPIFAVECKSGEKNVSSHLSYFQQRSAIPVFYQVHQGRRTHAVSDSIRVLPFREFGKRVGLV